MAPSVEQGEVDIKFFASTQSGRSSVTHTVTVLVSINLFSQFEYIFNTLNKIHIFTCTSILYIVSHLSIF